MSKPLITRVKNLESGLVTVTASTLAVTQTQYASKTILLNRAAGITVTLPATVGKGAEYSFILPAAVTSNSTIIKVANSTDIMGGVATMGSSGGTSASVGTASTSDTITFNGSTSGGLAGTRVELKDVAVGLWQVSVHGVASGIAVTPFSATV